MKLKLSTITGVFALGSGGYTFVPLIVESIAKGKLAYDACFEPISAFGLVLTALFGAVYAYLKPSPTQAKVIMELKK